MQPKRHISARSGTLRRRWPDLSQVAAQHLMELLRCAKAMSRAIERPATFAHLFFYCGGSENRGTLLGVLMLGESYYSGSMFRGPLCS